MAKQKIERIAADVATLLGETILEECQPEESPYPGIEERVRILAPGILSNILMAPRETVTLDGSIELPERIYNKLLMKLYKDGIRHLE